MQQDMNFFELFFLWFGGGGCFITTLLEGNPWKCFHHLYDLYNLYDLWAILLLHCIQPEYLFIRYIVVIVAVLMPLNYGYALNQHMPVCILVLSKKISRKVPSWLKWKMRYLWKKRNSEAAKIWQLSNCLIYWDCSRKVTCTLHFLGIPNSFCKHTHMHVWYIHARVLTLLSFSPPLFSVSCNCP